ncbi:MAG TPA: dTDP-4-dehydrorhamnose reductase [Pyrinomonadaceae bacterium]|nr:dTDP-4-dehydrorhamnose reductase [Pyrinomonadaceae bacterium]HMP64765.1 dTDP-4-dehydrorhamnose reductase [Pyrinomonadaceae bacterium]
MSVNENNVLNVMVTGAAGMLARVTAEHCRAKGDRVIAFTRAELDISDRAAVSEAVSATQPDVVFNCAAYTNVDAAEDEPEPCFAANAHGPENLAVACRKAGSAFVTISTDYVFGGEKEGYYYETDRPSPLSLYGRSKLEGEERVADANPDALIVRAGWIFGSDGRNFLSLIPSLVREQNSFSAISDVYGTPTFAGDLAARMRELAVKGTSGIFHIANTGGISTFYAFAREALAIVGGEDSLVAPVTADELKRKALRPKSSPLASVRLEETGLDELPAWQDSLRSFLDAN